MSQSKFQHHVASTTVEENVEKISGGSAPTELFIDAVDRQSIGPKMFLNLK